MITENDFVLTVVDELRDSMEFSYLKNLLSKYDFYFGFNESFQVGLYSDYDNIVYTKPSFYLNKEHYQQVIVSRAIRDNKKLNIQELTTISGDDFVREKKDFEEILALGDEELYAIFEKSFANQKLIIDSCEYELNFRDIICLSISTEKKKRYSKSYLLKSTCIT